MGVLGDLPRLVRGQPISLVPVHKRTIFSGLAKQPVWRLQA